MKIVKSEGCTSFYTRIDDKDLDEMSKSEKDSVLKKLIDVLGKTTFDEYHTDLAINSLLEIIEPSKHEDGGDCDQCGDSVYRRIYNFE